MESADLRIFEAVARLGGMNRAAGELNTVQSNVTARIRRLEEQLGVPLFERHSRGVVLTPAGGRLLPYARQVAHLLEDARRAVTDTGSPAGRLVIGALETTTALRLAPVLADFVTAHERVDLSLRAGTTEELIHRVLAREVEGAFVCGPVRHPDLEETTAFAEELALLTDGTVGSLDALAGRGEVKLVVLRAGCSYRLRLEGLLARRGIVDYRLLEFGTLEAIFGCVRAGLGITLLPRHLLGPVWEARGIVAHDLPRDEARVETVFIRRRDGFLSSAMRAFLEATRHRVADAAE